MPFGHCVHLWSFHISSGFVVTLGLNSLGTILLCLGLLQDSEKFVFGTVMSETGFWQSRQDRDF